MVDNDLQIINEVRAGNPRRYALLVDRHKDRAMSLAVRLVGNREEAEELVQDAFVRAFNGLGQFRGDARFSTWFYRIVYNLCMTRVSRRGWKLELLEDDDRGKSDNRLVDHEAISVFERMEEEELQKVVNAEIDRLPERFKSVVLLFYVQEMSYEEIAVVIDSPVGTV
ncbi:MAG: sigma-70 family RNA polymerase sigma factor, partial [Ignavibacteriae bacterium]|nr:sigma-70 family RNA polymerase sigma factor [Ignavibacteriota bacterium]